jgi:diguanylate cyclase (GGDEF)-like protein
MDCGMFLVVVVVLSSLRGAWEREKIHARTDSLTGVSNARAFFEVAAVELARARRYQRPFTIAYLDLDNFKQVNDRFGHEVGDDLLQIVARTLREGSRASDFVARMGGDEFVVLLETLGEA